MSALGEIDSVRPHSQSVVISCKAVMEAETKKAVIPILPLMYTSQYRQFTNLINHTMQDCSELGSAWDKKKKCETEYDFPLRRSIRNSISHKKRDKTPDTDKNVTIDQNIEMEQEKSHRSHKSNENLCMTLYSVSDSDIDPSLLFEIKSITGPKFIIT